MLALQEVTVRAGRSSPDIPPLLNQVSLAFPMRHLGAIVGPSGCGKSTLLRTIAGLMPTSAGTIFWNDVNVEERDLQPSELGYVPQFSIAHERLSIHESVLAACRLRVGGLSGPERESLVQRVLEEVELSRIADRETRVLSGGQRRRLALALELVSDPSLMLCDEVTSGLDPLAEMEIVSLLHRLAEHQDRLILLVTHSLKHLASFHSVTVLGAGRLLFWGTGEEMLHWFDVPTPDDVFAKLTPDYLTEWADHWQARTANLAPETHS
jgi:ABC-type multidrug transport system ATPase subunit